MKYKNYVFVFVGIVIIYWLYCDVYKESFVPKIIKESYRPIERNMRHYYEGFFNHTSSSIVNFARKYRIL